jgi:hypothetical protein
MAATFSSIDFVPLASALILPRPKRSDVVIAELKDVVAFSYFAGDKRLLTVQHDFCSLHLHGVFHIDPDIL